jgi:hypothetical protein
MSGETPKSKNISRTRNLLTKDMMTAKSNLSHSEVHGQWACRKLLEDLEKRFTKEKAHSICSSRSTLLRKSIEHIFKLTVSLSDIPTLLD